MLDKITSLIKLVAGDVDFIVEMPTEKSFGDYSTNVAFKLAAKKEKHPIAVAQKLAEEIKKADKAELFEKIEAVAPGFINFWLSKNALQEELGAILKEKGNYGKTQIAKGKSQKINIEFISANPTGPLTLGNGRGAFLGNTLANILEAVGHKITREYYVNDAKSSNQIKELGKTTIGKGTTYLTNYLRKKLKTNGLKLKTLTKKIKDNDQLYGEAGHLIAQEIHKDNKKFIENELKIKFDVWFSEDSLYQQSLTEKILEILKKAGLAYEKEGALWFKATLFGDNEDRVLVRWTGEPTYFLSDIAYHFNKLIDRKFDKVIDIWGADHHGYVARLKAGLKAIKINPDKLFVIITQLVRLVRGKKEVKMSKRKGIYVTLAELIKKVGKDASAFFLLMNSPDSHMNFDLKLAAEKSLKNPVYYAQYAAVRCGSILKKSKIKNQKSKLQSKNLNLLTADSELNLIRELIKFPDIMIRTAKDYEAHRLTHYTLDIARSLHDFYEKERVIIDDKKLMAARLALVSATKIVLENLFGILGISAPKKM